MSNASTTLLPPPESPPVSAMENPILIGSAACAGPAASAPNAMAASAARDARTKPRRLHCMTSSLKPAIYLALSATLSSAHEEVNVPSLRAEHDMTDGASG